MNNPKLLWEITRWEFLRWFKIKDQLKALFYSITLSLLVWGGIALFEKFNSDS